MNNHAKLQGRDLNACSKYNYKGYLIRLFSFQNHLTKNF
uniref:Uncharacterized protein n=1 Tax=Rhizophora mucronata TaxID=61149 RepID=A0A2P2NB76_RHIMU